jgi:RNA polymerase sigma-70 factor (ECF subfamily)
MEDESQAATVAALARVPAAQRAALVLRHVDGFSVPEVADLLGRSVEAVESLLARGRVSLRRAYLEETR